MTVLAHLTAIDVPSVLLALAAGVAIGFALARLTRVGGR